MRDVDGLDVGSVAAFFLDAGRVVVVGRGFVDGAAHVWDVDVDDLFFVCVEDGAEVEWEGILAVVNVRAVVHQCLLEAHVAAEAVIVADCPGWGELVLGVEIKWGGRLTVAVYFVHVCCWDAAEDALLNHLRIFAHNSFHLIQIFHSNLPSKSVTISHKAPQLAIGNWQFSFQFQSTGKPLTNGCTP